MSSVKVIDLNETVEEEQPALEPFKEVKEEAPEPEITNEVVEEPAEAIEETPAEPTPKPKAKPKASDIVPCPDCNKNMTYKNLRYSHKCSPEPPPVKKQANPKPKTKPKQVPKPPPSVYYSDSSSEEEVIVRRKKKKASEATSDKRVQQPPSTPTNPLTDITNHYQLLHQQMIQAKQERDNNLCKNIFAPRVKKR